MRRPLRFITVMGLWVVAGSSLGCETQSGSNAAAIAAVDVGQTDTALAQDGATLAEAGIADVGAAPDVVPTLETALAPDLPAAPAFCPPLAPFGTKKGVSLQDVKLKACDGKDVALHDLCGAKAGLFYLFAGW